MHLTPPVIQRFWEKVDKSGEHWLWTASCRHGYGQLNIGNNKIEDAHRISYQLHHGSIPEGMDIDHECRVTQCVKPEHLRAITHKQNLENRGASKDSKTGIRGVSWNASKGRWGVFVCHHGKQHFGGWFTDIEDAESAAISLRNDLYTHNSMDRGFSWSQ